MPILKITLWGKEAEWQRQFYFALMEAARLTYRVADQNSEKVYIGPEGAIFRNRHLLSKTKMMLERNEGKAILHKIS